MLLAAAPARADDGLRCGQWLVGNGASQAEVAAKCGDPTAADDHEERVRTRWGICLQHHHRLLDVTTAARATSSARSRSGTAS